ncbi:MAG: zf-HC2 domain-containing protein [Phycisphaerales bacterium]|nr:zf-HC2 domain-containing protein [Phycisphaerales bacterium]
MNCKDVRKWMSPYMDSELDPTKIFEISEHLRSCPKCKARFERERGIDDLIRSRLERDRMPSDLWMRISRKVSMPFWLRQLTRPSGIAAAVCLALLIFGAIGFWPRDTGDERPWLVRELALLAADDDFTEDTSTVRTSERLLRDLFGIEIAASTAHPHALALIKATTQVDENGHEYVQVHLNCCGNPVLMVLARPGDGPMPTPFDGAPFDQDGGTDQIDGINIMTKNFGDIMAVVASTHAVEQIAKSLQINKV